MTEALALERAALVLVRAIPGAATAAVPFPPWTTMILRGPKVVDRLPALEEVIVAEPEMVVPWARPAVLTRTSRVSVAPAAKVPIEQMIFPDPEDEQLVPEAAMPLRS